MLKNYVTEFDINAGEYLKEIGYNSPLSKEEEGVLANRWKQYRDVKARNKLVESNLKFVANVARNYKGLGLSYSDLIQEGNLGLFKAVDRFEPERGNKFISYAVSWVKQSIIDALRKKNSIKGDELPNETIDENNEYDDLILDDAYLDITQDDDSQYKDIKTVANFLLSNLDNRERFIVCQYNGINEKKNKTLEEIGNILGLTKERVRQINEKALKKMRVSALNNSIDSTIYKR